MNLQLLNCYEFGDGGGVESLMDDKVPAPWEKEEKDEL